MRARWMIPLSVLAIGLILAGMGLRAYHNDVRYLDLPGRSDQLPFSHLAVAGSTLYVAGTLGLDPDTGQPPADPKTEARLALDGVKNKLALDGASMDDLVSVQIFCPDPALYEDFNAVYRTYFDSHFPTRSFIGSGPLLRGARFEINAVAVKR